MTPHVSLPPSDSIPLIHSTCDLYKEIYLLSSKLPKRDRFGIYLKLEAFCLNLFTALISAAFAPKNAKYTILVEARVTTEVIKRLVRLMHELNIVETRKYTELETRLQEISKMTNGWIKYVH